ncbi:MAG: cell division protein FtsA [Bacillota bacterium]
MTEQELLFSMDIGTRTVVGIVGCHDGEKFKILAHEVEEHKERAMYDGQVHDIELVAKAAAKVKDRLEKKLGVQLKRVSIAAAGRSLKTCKTFVERETDIISNIDRELISSLEIEAIQKAQHEVEKMQHEDDLAYYCVGYAIVNFYLNGNVIGNLEGHKGKKVGIEVLATFLPKVVVDSLYAVVARVDLEVSSLTLEPIAAMNVSIHSNLRLLNIALVDIGAGTSDIALTKSGTVFAFAMAPVAGDEITEKLAENYLLDFDTAEKVKINLSKKDKIKFRDVMGITQERTNTEMLDSIKPAIQQLAKEISDRIIEFNGKSPSAVFLIGGGSQIPLLPQYIAEYLQISAERVGVRKADIIRDVEINNKKLINPEFITPIGIAVTAYMNRQKDFLQVTVNDKNVKLFNSKTLTVADALILVGYNPRNLIGRRGESISFILNGKTETVKGEPGEPAKIFLNGARVSLDNSISNGDKITIDPAVDGKAAKIFIRDYITDFPVKKIYIDGKAHVLRPAIMKNNALAMVDEAISDGDVISIKQIDRLEDLIKYFDITDNNTKFLINGKEAQKDSLITNGDIISVEIPEEKPQTQSDSANMNHGSAIDVWVNGKLVRMQDSAKSQFIFVDVFNFIDINPREIKGKINMKLNGNYVNYTDPLINGDRIEIEWDN